MTAAEEHIMVTKALAGDQEAWTKLYENQARFVRGMLSTRLGWDNPDIEDLVQDVMLQVFKYLRGFETRSRLSTWVGRIAINTASNHHRLRTNKPATYTRISLDDTSHVGRQHAEWDTDIVERRELVREDLSLRYVAERIDLERTIAKLAPASHEVFLKQYVTGLSAKEIGSDRGVPISTIKSMQFKARRKVQKKLGLAYVH